MNLGEMVVSFTANLSGLTAGVSQAKTDIASVGTTAQATGSQTSHGFLGAIGSVVDFGAKIGQTVIGVQGLAQGAIGLGNALLSGNASMEQTRVGFVTLLGSGQKADAFLKQMAAFAASTPFEFPEVATAAQHMIAFGFSAKDVIPALTDIGDAMSAMGKGPAEIESIINVFGQMKAAGKVTAQDMMQISSQGIPAWKYLAAAMHLTIPEVQALSQKGLIPADTAIKALRDGMHQTFGGGMAAQATTFNGLMSTLQDNVGAAMRAFTGPLFTMAKDGLTQLGNLVTSPAFQQFATTLGQQVGGALSTVAKFVQGQVLPALIKLAPVAQDIGMWFVRSFGDMMPILGQVGQVIGNVFGHLVEYLSSDAFAGFMADIETLGNQIQQLIGGGLQVLGPLIEGAFSIIGPILTGFVLPAIDTLIFDISQVISFFQQNQAAAQILGAALIGIGVAFAAIQIGAFLATVPALITGFIAWATTAGAAAIATIAATWPLLAIGAVIAAVVAGIILLVTHWGDVTKFLQGVWTNFTTWFMGVLGNIGGFFVGVWNNIASFFTGIWNSLVGGAQAGGNAFSDWWNGLWQGVQNVFQTIWSFLQNVAKIGLQILLAIILGPIYMIANLFIWLYQHNIYFQRMIDAIVGFVRAGIAWLQAAWTAAVTLITGLWNRLVAKATAIWTVLTVTIQSAINRALAVIQAIWTVITNWISAQWNKIVFIATAAWSLLTSTIQAAINKVFAVIQVIWTLAANWLQAQWNKIAGFATAAWQAVSSVFSGIWNNYIAKPLSDLWNRISKWFSDLASQFLNAGANFINMLVQGITSGAGAIWNAVVGIAQNIWKALGFHSPPKAGPASDSDTWMPNFVDMLVSGINAGVPKIARASNALAGSLALSPGAYTAGTMRSGAFGVSAGSPSSGNDIHVHLEVDGEHLASIVAPHVDKRVRVKFGPRGRV